MKQKLKTVYVPVKVEDELPEIGKMVFTLNTMIPGKVKYPPKDDGKNISINNRVSEIQNKCEQWYAFDKGGLLPILISLGGAIDMLVIIGLLVVLKQHLFKSTPKQNSIIKEFIMAKYKKYCPKINWS